MRWEHKDKRSRERGVAVVVVLAMVGLMTVLAVGMMGPSSARGGAALSTQVFHGGASGLSATPRRVIFAQAMGDAFPGPLRGPGDVNGDGFADLCVTSAYADGVYRLTRTGVFAGSASGISATPLGEIIEGSLSE